MSASVHLLVELESGLTLFHLKDGNAPPNYLQEYFVLTFFERTAFEIAIRRFKTLNRTTLDKVFARLFPQAREVAITQTDYRLLINELIDGGSEVLVFIFDEGGKPEIEHGERTDENGEHVNKDGIPSHEINTITGVPYSRAPEGMNRYIVSIIYDGGVSYSDVHKMVMAPTAREACQQEIAFINSDDNPMKKNPTAWAIFGGGTVIQSFARNVDTDETGFFNGPDCAENAETKVMNSLFAMLSQ